VLSDFRSNVEQLRASDFGMVFGIMMLEMELELTNYLSAMVAKLSELSGIRVKAIDCAGPDISEAEFPDFMTITDMNIEDVISKINTLNFTETGHLQLEQKFMVMMSCLFKKALV
jgi:hypothetical protein